MNTATDHQLIAVARLNFAYGNFPVFVDFEWASDQQVSVIRGPSGCGKTTLLKLLLGVLRPSERTQVSAPSPRRMILQDDSLCPWLSGWDNLEIFTGKSREAIRAHSLFALVSGFVDRPAYQLSFGQRRLVELLRIFLPGEGLLLLDEPLNYLDKGRRALVLKFLNNDLGSAMRVVLTTHLTDELTLKNADQFEFAGDPPHSRLLVNAIDHDARA